MLVKTTKQKQFKAGVRYFLRENSPVDIIEHLRKFYEIDADSTQFSFTACIVVGNYVLDENGVKVAHVDTRPYFKVYRDEGVPEFDVSFMNKVPRFENVWYELRSDAVGEFNFTRQMLIQLGIVENSVFRFKPEYITDNGDARVGYITIAASNVQYFNRELNIHVGKSYKIRPTHVGVVWNSLTTRARTLLHDHSTATLDTATYECTAIGAIEEQGDGRLWLIDNGVAVIPLDIAKFALYEV